jgi:energy-coupling factor transport system substrate-specific component
MSWQLASFAVLGLALTGGFGWFERSRPPARVVSLVAALAALAVIGRIAFAPIPNVKPTTDIVLFAGYALGAAPGFAVGAVTALVSNFFISQGPWTPWQMAGWGLVGIGGAALARVAGRELGRLSLAIACGLAGLAFGAVMNTYLWTLAADHDAATFVAISGTSLPFDLAHVAGNVAFCLALGPAFVRALERFRLRFEVRWPEPRAAALPVLLGAVLAGGLLSPEPSRASATSRAVSYLVGAQNSDGGFGGGPGASSNQLHTGWAALGLAAGGRNPADVVRGGNSVVDYIRAHAGSLDDTGELERTILVLRASSLSARDFAGRDLVAELKRRQRTNGSWLGNIGFTHYGVLALRAAGEKTGSAAVRRARTWLLRVQGKDGGWGVAPGAGSDVDDTGAVLQAVAAGGLRSGKRVERAVAFLKRNVNSDGGLGQLRGYSSNAQSTAWAVQGVIAVGRSAGVLKRKGRTALEYIRSLQTSSGMVRFSRSSSQTPVWVTAQAIPALAGKPFPLRPVARRKRVAGGDSARAAERRRKDAARRRGEGSGNEGDAGGGPGGGGGPVAPGGAPTLGSASRAAGSAGDDGGGGPAAWLVLGAAGLALLAAAGIVWLVRGRLHEAVDGGPTGPPDPPAA